MIGWFLNFIHGNKPKSVHTEDSVNEGDSIVLDNGIEETIEKTESESVQKVCNDLMEMTDEEFDAELKKHMSFEEGECHPAECDGECDGMGWCEIATVYRTKTDHRKGIK